MQLRVSALLIAVGSLAVSSCDDPLANAPRLSNREAFPIAFTLNGTPVSAPTGLRVRAQNVFAIGPALDFDLAFDITPAGDSVIVYTVAAVANQLFPTHRVGLQTSTGTFDQITEAPRDGFVYDSTFRVAIGQTVLIDVIETACTFESIVGLNIRAKMVVDSVNTVTRKVFLHTLTNQNCGLRNLQPGEPRD
jgi:hypothetical protein